MALLPHSYIVFSVRAVRTLTSILYRCVRLCGMHGGAASSEAQKPYNICPWLRLSATTARIGR